MKTRRFETQLNRWLKLQLTKVSSPEAQDLATRRTHVAAAALGSMSSQRSWQSTQISWWPLSCRDLLELSINLPHEESSSLFAEEVVQVIIKKSNKRAQLVH